MLSRQEQVGSAVAVGTRQMLVSQTWRWAQMGPNNRQGQE